MRSAGPPQASAHRSTPCGGDPVSHCSIRALGPDDAAAYQALRLRGLREHPEAFTSSAEQDANALLTWARQRLAGDAARPHDFFLGAFDSDALIGIVGLEARYRPKERHNATLVGMYVPRERAGAGVGRLLAVALVARARANPVLEQIDLTVTAGNVPAQALYEHCGFSVVGLWPRAVRIDGRYLDKVRMQLQLR